MANKFEEISRLADDAARQIVRNKEEWMKYLDTAARLYRYPFREQMLIYAQRPDATACASIGIWNDRMNCWVRRGAKGIALIDDDASGKNKLKYLFDVSDVTPGRYNGRLPKLWKMEEKYQDRVIADLEKIYGSTSRVKTFEGRLDDLAKHITADYYEELLPELMSSLNGSFLYGLDDLNVGKRLRETVENSISYTLLSRCGCDMKSWKEELDFDYIHEFNSVDALMILGNAVSELTKPILMQMGRSINAMEQELAKEAAREGISEKSVEITSKVDYNALKRESEHRDTDHHNSQNGQNIEGGNGDGINLHSERGLSDPESQSERGTAGAAPEIRGDEEKVPEGELWRNVLGDAPEGDAQTALSGGTEPGTGDVGISGKADAGERGSERSTEGIRSDGMGTQGEQHPEPGRGNRSGRESIQPVKQEYEQMSLFPSMEEQVGKIAAAEAQRKFVAPAAFSLDEEQINAILRTGGNRDHSRKRIYAKYQESKDASEMAALLRKEYETTAKGFTMDGNPISVWFDQNGMKLGYGMSAKEAPFLSMGWEEIESRIRTMVENGSYMPARDVFLVEATEAERIANHVYFLFRDGIDDFPESLGIGHSLYPDAINRLVEMLGMPEGTAQVETEVRKAVQMIESGQKHLLFRMSTTPAEILQELTDHKNTRINYPVQDAVPEMQQDFVTQDEIDAVLSHGSGYNEGQMRIYDYFQGQHTKEETVAFLKNEYGIGGRSHALIGSDHGWEDHDSKGIQLKKGNISDPYADVLLSWSVVAKRIRELIAADQYLSPEEKTQYPEWKQTRTEREMQRVQERLLKEKEIAEAEKLPAEEIPKEDAAGEPETREPAGTTEDVTETPENVTEADDSILVPTTEQADHRQHVNEPEIDRSKAVNFHITDDNLGTGSPKEKFQRNISAIKTLNTIELENRIATPQEQEILSGYVGWGGLADAFDQTKSGWTAEYQELKSLLTPEEYASARESTLNAHYTSPAIINSIYDTMNRMGFHKGNVLEPAMGIGNFFGMLPQQMQESKLYGVELDGLSGRIAKQLYPKAHIQIRGYEKTNFPNDFFDAAVGNVPFGQYKVNDRPYNKNNFLIHDYFFAKTLDKVRPGGIVAFVTSKGTMDKESEEVRKYLAQRADLMGAVRLPNTAFKANAGTEVTSDILFLQKRDRIMDIEPDWVHLSEKDGIRMNSYFAEHPEMIVGKMEMVSGPFGMESTCQADNSRPFAEQLKEAAERISGVYQEAQIDEDDLENDLTAEVIPADPEVKNFSYTVVDGSIYYRENSIMRPIDVSDAQEERLRGMIAIRDSAQELINLQLEDVSDAEIHDKQTELNAVYDDFEKKFGSLNSQTNKRVFNQDSSYCLLSSLERMDDEGNVTGKADMFSKRTIKHAQAVTSVDTASEALTVSLQEKAKVDLAYMAELSGKDEDAIAEELSGVIFKNPMTEQWETADEYLSGNVRNKLALAENAAGSHPEYAVNVEALKKVQPKELDASEIEVRIGATWIDPKYMEDFMQETFETPGYLMRNGVIGIQYSDVTGLWNVKGKNADRGNALANMTYGTSRASAYKILEDSLNLKDCRIYDTEIEDGKEKRVLNKRETTLASQKQESIREAFKNWVFKDQERREVLCRQYNELFNSTRPREFDGSHLKFPGMTPDISLRPHQMNAIAHVLYGDNTLLAHCVGAGKTYEMTTAAMESKRLGLCQKSLFVVPNHLTEQWASDFLRLYPGANILAATKKDFEPANRKKFCSRIATGEYDAVIIGHSQFEKIPLSRERQAAIIEKQVDEIEESIALAKADRGERYTIKQMEKTKKSLNARLEKLNDDSRKDDVVTFEQLGVDRLFVDESHNYKNLFLYTKMNNVAGISQTEAQKSSDMFAKCQYLDELTGGRGVTFATGTPISNSMTELYTNMRYLQYGTLQRLGLGHFDSWASSFGETQTAIELAPEGTGYRAKTRFAKFYNLPELISLFKESADIQTPDMLKLPVPDAEFETVVLKPSENQKDMVASLAERAEKVRNRMVDSATDNMLKITNDGRKLALDQRLINDMLPDDPNSKTSKCAEKAYQIYEKYSDDKAAQLIFCDLSTPKGDGSYNVYDDIRQKLMEKGVPEKEIAFIHEANTEKRKAELFGKVRSGQVRFLLGSTAKMGAGTNVQDRLIALHHLDCPWRPSDIEQREGRIIRQGNLFKDKNVPVKVFKYVTEGTFDAYSWQVIENKQKFIGQIMTSKSPVRSCEDVDESALSYAEVKALATGNPYIKEKMQMDVDVSKLKLAKANHTSMIYRLEDNIAKNFPMQISRLKERIAGFEADIAKNAENTPAEEDVFSMKIGDRVYSERKEAGTALIDMCHAMKDINASVNVGEYRGFGMALSFDSFNKCFVLNLRGQLSHNMQVGADASGNITRINNLLDGMTKTMEEDKSHLENTERQLAIAKQEVVKPFEKEQELTDKLSRLAELNALLNMDEKGNEGIAAEDQELTDDQTDGKASYVAERPSDQQYSTMSEERSVYQTKEKTADKKTERPKLPKIQGRESLKAKLAERKAQLHGGLSDAGSAEKLKENAL